MCNQKQSFISNCNKSSSKLLLLTIPVLNFFMFILNTPRIAIDKAWSSVLTHIATFFTMEVMELNYYELQFLFLAVVNFKMFFMA